MAGLDEAACLTIQALAQKGLSNRVTARPFGVSEGVIRYPLRCMQEEAPDWVPDGRSHRSGLADDYAEAIDRWRASGGGVRLVRCLIASHWGSRSERLPARLHRNTANPAMNARPPRPSRTTGHCRSISRRVCANMASGSVSRSRM